MTDAPLRICITIAGYEERPQYDPYWTIPTGAAEEIEYHLHTREALAQSPIVQAMIAEAFRAGFMESGEGWNGEYPTKTASVAKRNKWLDAEAANHIASRVFRRRG